MTDQKQDFRFDSMDIVIYLWKKRVPLIIITVAAGIISIIGSLMITPKFKSSVVLFATSDASAGKVIIQENYQEDMQAFGEEEQVEPVMQVLKSDLIRDRIIEKYDLMNHYQIDQSGKSPLFKLHKYYSNSVQIKRTEYNSIIVSVLDEDPVIAAAIANDIALLVDSAIWGMKSERADRALAFLEEEMARVDSFIQVLQDTMLTYNKKGVISFERQIERLTEAHGKAILAGNKTAQREIRREIASMAENTSEFLYCWDKYNDEINRLDIMRNQYLQLKAERDSRLPTVFVLDKAQVTDKKAYPRKSIIVIVATFSTFLLAALLFLFFENFVKRLRGA